MSCFVLRVFLRFLLVEVKRNLLQSEIFGIFLHTWVGHHTDGFRARFTYRIAETVSIGNFNHIDAEYFPIDEVEKNLSKKFGKEINDLWDSFGTDFTYPGNLPAYVEEYFEEQDSGKSLGVGSDVYHGRVQCLPLPGPFLPCEDLFDWWTLRCGVWIVFLLAMLGNGTVVFVLVFSRSKMDVPRFLVCNLAMADFFMGIYLGFLAVVDASTLGEFRKYAIPWQMSAGCQLAGFLGVLSSELSVYTLAVITLERNYAITHAMHLNKRLSLKHAAYIMAVGWSFALVMALLPLVGVSDYRIFAVCLPFEAERPHSLAYVVFLMLINGVAFLILMGCYLKMYCAIRGSQAWNSNDSRIAKRMALLVFTDFLCWSPIAFFSLTAAFGLQLVSLEQAKVFTVFVLPLNSCCNPFLYAILTKQFKKDCVLICKAIEESRVTRGIGRCRHSSNFSNRQTPANTNSLVDRSSREHVHAGGQIPCTCTAKLLTHGHLGAGVGAEAGAPHVASASNMTRGRGKSAGAGPNAATTSTSSNSSAPVASTSSSTRLRPGRGSDSSTLNPRRWLMGKASWLLCHRDGGRRGQGRNSGGRGTGGGGGGGSRARSDQYAHQIAEIQQKQHKRASSVSSENFSSSRSDSWRQNNCGLPLRLLDPKKRSSWLVTRKTSQDSNLSSSRNDSSGTATSASTATWRMSRSSASGCTAAAASATITAAAATAAATSDALSRPRSASPNSAISPEQHSPPSIAAAPAHQQHQPHHHHHHHTHLHHPHDWTTAVHHGGATPRTVLASVPRPKPRLTRQSAISDDEPPGSPGRLAVRFLTTIPSAAETSVQNDEEEADQGPAEEDGEDDLAMTPLVTGRRSLPTVRLVALPAGSGVQQRRPSALSSPPRTLVALQLLDSRPTALVPLRRCSTGQTSQVSPGGGSTQNRSPQSVRSSPAPSPTLSPRSPGTGEAGIAGTSGTSGVLGTSRSTGPTGTSGATPREEKPT
ncbi:hypothetical protein J437_LFUL011634 [Ladona fulva]|uniref:G-protein coupled receptors family 1 profile domain-containing protein n=1 Tax=Ladona fulva TaxID=123851 RepID=A0A8K0K3T9_LADFU|nr:hypothetical protein J437_LFUL011634 [Ladona fulva]